MRHHLEKRLELPDNVVFTCQNSGACCRNDWLIGVDDASHARLETVDWQRHDPSLPAGPKFRKLPLPLLSGETITFARTPQGACVFLDPQAKCSIHRHFGYDTKPQVCREFPYSFVETPDGVAVGVSFACTAVRGHHGQALADQQSEIQNVLGGSSRVHTVPDPITLYSGVDIDWQEYRRIESAVLDVLGRTDQRLPVALMAGSVLVTVSVGLCQVERRARAQGGTPRETLESGLAQLKSEGYRRLFDIAAGVRYPRRASSAYLAPLHAWLRLSRRRTPRFALVAALYADYFKFRSFRGTIPDLVTNQGRIDLAAVQRVRFETDATDVDAFLREYWSHVVFRKTLTPMHGVFRGYHTLLALYGFTKWAAKLHAVRHGRLATTLDDVKEAVRLVEQRFVLHAQFVNVFSLSAVLTVMADRLYAQPSFVPAAVLEPDVLRI